MAPPGSRSFLVGPPAVPCVWVGSDVGASGAQALAAPCATRVEDLAAGLGGHARTKPVPPLADKVRRLESAFHHMSPSVAATSYAIVCCIALDSRTCSKAALYGSTRRLSTRHRADIATNPGSIGRNVSFLTCTTGPEHGKSHPISSERDHPSEFNRWVASHGTR